MRKILLFFVMVMTMFGIHASNKVVFDLQTMSPTLKAVDMTPNLTKVLSGDSLIVSLSFRYVTIIQEEDGSNRIEIPSFYGSLVEGMPILPFRHLRYPVAEGCGADVVILSHEYVEMPMAIMLAPEVEIDGIGSTNGSTSSVRNPTEGFYPSEAVKASQNLQYYRGRGFLPVNLFPVQYDETNHIARISTSLSYAIVTNASQQKSAGVQPSRTGRLQIAEDDTFFDDFMETVPDNNARNSSKPDNNAGDSSKIVTDNYPDGTLLPTPYSPYYLILTTTALKPAATKLANWKKMLGYNTNIICCTTSAPWTPELIKTRIASVAGAQRYFYYLLILGDADAVPGEEFSHPDSSCGKYMTDLGYACLDGDDDTTPDLYYGRIPASNLEEANSAIEKIIYYEQHPSDSENTYKRGFHIGNFEDHASNPGEEDRAFVYTCDMTRYYLTINSKMNIQRIYTADPSCSPRIWSNTYVGEVGEEKALPNELLRPTYSWTATSQDYLDAFSSNVLYGMYRGHGFYTGWGTMANFNSTKALAGLTNKNNYPLFFSITCQTGAYNKSSMCLAKALLTSKQSGASGVIAASEATYSGYNDILAGAILRAIWPESKTQIFPRFVSTITTALDLFQQLSGNPKTNIGEVLNFGTTIVESCYPTDYIYALATKRLFHVFGDPSLAINTSVPKNVTDVSVIKDDSGFTIKGSYLNYPNGAIVTVVDTMYYTTIAMELLRDCHIDASRPDRCKIVISGKSIKPLIVEGSKGYIGGWHSADRREYAADDLFVDFRTGERYSLSHNDESDKTAIVESDEYLDFEFKGAYVVTDEKVPGTEYWEIPGSDAQENANGPRLPWVSVSYELTKKVPEDMWTLDSFEYTDIPDVECMPGCLYIDTAGDDYEHYGEITPYEGFFPKGLEYIQSCQEYDYYGDKGIHYILFVTPLSYDYQNKVMRCYNKIRFKRTSPNYSGVDEVEIEDATAKYYTIDGRHEPNPKKGTVYIVSRGVNREKIVF